MVKTPSTMLALGTQAPAFNLPDVISGESISLDNFSANKALLVMFLCSHCHVLLALWDGKPSDQLGGTAQVVRSRNTDSMVRTGLVQS